MTTVTRSFRLDEKLLQKLASLARKYGQTENQLVSSWLSWRIGFDPLIPAFDGVGLTTETFGAILDMCNVDALETLASEMGRKHYKASVALFESSGEHLTFVKFATEILSKRGGWFRIEGDVDETSRELTLHHKFTTKWSVFLKGYICGAYESVSRKHLNVDITDSFIRLKLNQSEESKYRF